MANGLLKAYFQEPLKLTIPSCYSQSPDRYGVTLAYGQFDDSLLEMVGKCYCFYFEWLVIGKETCFLTCQMPMHPLEIRRLQQLELKSIHATIGWRKRSAPVVAKKECLEFWKVNQDNPWYEQMNNRKLRAIFFGRALWTTVEFQEFKGEN